jgi:amino acid transporter
MVSIGAFAGLTTTMLVGLLTVTKIAYAMARDGLLPEFLSWIHPSTNSTLVGSIFVGVLAAVFSFVLKIDDLADVVSIGILFAFIIVSICVFMLRIDDSATSSNLQTKAFVVVLLAAICAGVVVTSGLLLTGAKYYYVLPTSISFLLPCVILVVFYHQNVAPSTHEAFRTPFVPYIPLLSIVINTYMLCNLKGISWLAFLVALAIGVLIYLIYGIKHSRVGNAEDGQHHTAAAADGDDEEEVFRLAK